MKRGKTKPLVKAFPKERTQVWSKQQLFIKLSNQKQETREPYLFGSSRSIYTIAKFSSR
jgi:hypothetical protein